MLAATPGLQEVPAARPMGVDHMLPEAQRCHCLPSMQFQEPSSAQAAPTG